MIDFYFGCNDFLAYDLSVCLVAWCFDKDGAYNMTEGMALIEGYQGSDLAPRRGGGLAAAARGPRCVFS